MSKIANIVVQPVSTLPITPKQVDALMREGLYQVIDVINLGSIRLSNITGIGPKAVHAIKGHLSSLNIAWETASE